MEIVRGEQVGRQFGFFRIEQIKLELRTGLDPADQEINGTPGCLEALEVGRVQKHTHRVTDRAVDARDDFRLARIDPSYKVRFDHALDELHQLVRRATGFSLGRAGLGLLDHLVEQVSGYEGPGVRWRGGTGNRLRPRRSGCRGRQNSHLPGSRLEGLGVLQLLAGLPQLTKQVQALEDAVRMKIVELAEAQGKV